MPKLAEPRLDIVTNKRAPIDKVALRRQLRRQRLTLTPLARLAASYQAIRHLRALAAGVRYHPTTTRKLRVGVFVDAFGEMPTQPLIDWAYQQGFAVYLPVVTKFVKTLEFIELYQPNLHQARLTHHRLGMRQPAKGNRLCVNQLDLLFMPLVAMDNIGNRMGMGGGFYDRSLAKSKIRPLKIGWAYDFQMLELLDTNPWDIKLDMAVTPKRLWYFRRYLHSVNLRC